MLYIAPYIAASDGLRAEFCHVLLGIMLIVDPACPFFYCFVLLLVLLAEINNL